jgi:hypothetical protein
LLGNTFQFWVSDALLALMNEKDESSTTASFNKLAKVQNEIVENKRLGSVPGAYSAATMKYWKNKINVPGPKKVCRSRKTQAVIEQRNLNPQP